MKRKMGNCFSKKVIPIDTGFLIKHAFEKNDIVLLNKYLTGVYIKGLDIGFWIDGNTQVETIRCCMDHGYKISEDLDILRQSFAMADDKVFVSWYNIQI